MPRSIYGRAFNTQTIKECQTEFIEVHWNLKLPGFDKLKLTIPFV